MISVYGVSVSARVSYKPARTLSGECHKKGLCALLF
jgi:hypothetical protein